MIRAIIHETLALLALAMVGANLVVWAAVLKYTFAQ